MNKELTVNEKIKIEICNNKYTKEELFLILQSMFLNNIQLKLNNKSISYIYQSSFIPLIKFIKKSIGEFNLSNTDNIDITDSNLFNNQNIIGISFDESLDNLFTITNFDYTKKRSDYDKKFFLIGAYLSTGSISYSMSKSSYHFEIKSHKNEFANYVCNILNDFGLGAKIITYRNNYVVYFKKAQYISDILKLFNATEAMYEFEDHRIKRDFINSNQRLNNLDISNLNKTVKASNDQITWIKFIKENNYFHFLSDKVRNFANLRLSNPELSLNDLVELYKSKYKVNITRSTINYYIQTIKKMYLKITNY